MAHDGLLNTGRRARLALRSMLATVVVWMAMGAGPAVAAEPPTTLSSRLPGKLLVESGRGRAFDTHLIELASGRSQILPRSPAGEAQSSADVWRPGQPGGSGTLVRTDPIGNLAFFDGRSLREDGGIALQPLRERGLDPKFRSAVPSPDGRLLAGYWWPNGDGKPRLFVITRGLKLIDNGSPLRYPSDGATQAIDWLPDGRYVYLAGDTLVVARPGGGIVSQGRLALPRGVDPEGARLKASPDGRHVLLTMDTRTRVPLGLLFTARIDGSEVKLLTEPGGRLARDNDVRLSMQGATWSPDGRWIAFVVRGVNPGVAGAYSACQPVLVVPFDGASHVIDGVGDEERYGLRVRGESTPLKACGTVGWLP